MTGSFPIELPGFLEQADGEIRVTGHRISLYHVLTEFNAGQDAEEIALRFPTLKLATIYKIIGYYLEHQPVIDPYLADYRRSLDDQAAQIIPGPSKAELLGRLEQIRLKAHHAAHVSH